MSNRASTNPLLSIPPVAGSGFPDPYKDLASFVLPTTINEALDWAEFIAITNGVYFQAISRIASYCVTDVEVVPDKEAIGVLDKEKRERYLKLFSKKGLNAVKLAYQFAQNLLIYGNVFVSLHMRFTRYLECPECHAIMPYNAVIENDECDFRFTDFEFNLKCPKCKKRHNFIPDDKYSSSPEDLFVKWWNPHDMDLVYDAYTGDCSCIWRIPREYISLIRNGDKEAIATCPLEVIEIIKDGKNMRFDPNVLMFAKEDSLVGIRANGWGIPRCIPNFRSAWYWQLIQRYNEVLATDFIMPTRVLSPPAGADQPADAVYSTGMEIFKTEMQNLIQEHRRDPAAWLISPQPVQYQTFGGDAATFLPREQLEHGMNTMLSSIGIPQDLYQGTLQVQAAPVALRLFENTWQWLVNYLNEFLDFLSSRTAFYLNEAPVELRFKRITHADDMARSQSIMQLMSAGEVSKTTGLATLGINKREEVRLQAEEDRDTAEIQKAQEEDTQLQQQMEELVPSGITTALQEAQNPPPEEGGGGGAPPSGGGAPPAGGGGGAPAGAPMPGGGSADPLDQMIAEMGTQPYNTPQEMMEKAQTLVQQMQQMGPQRASALRKLKAKDPQMHMLVKGLLQDADSQMRSQGFQQMRGY